MTLKIQPLFLAGLLLSLSVFAVSAQEVELRDSLEAARITAMRRMQRDVGEMLTSPEHMRATASPLGEGDALRWVQSLPGVATGADGTSAFYVRGGNSGGNLLTVDGIPVYGYSHVLGITAILPADVIGSASFAKGGFGGAQGNYTSSHVALRTVDPGSGSPRRIHATLNNFLTGAGISMSVGGQGSVVAAARVSPLSLEYAALKGLMQGGLGDLRRLGAGVFDVYGKFSWRFNERNRISAWVLGSMDRYSFITSDGSDESMGWGNVIGAVQSEHDFGWIRLDLSASYNGYRSGQEQKKDFRAKQYNFSLQSTLDEITLSADGRISLGSRFSVNAGAQGRLGFFAPVRAAMTSSRTTTFLLAGWLQAEWKSEHLKATGGARLNMFNDKQNGKSVSLGMPDFNVSVKWQPFPFVALEGTFDRISQYYHVLEGLPLGWSMDLLVPASADLPAEQMMQGYAGLEFTFGKSQLSVGAFLREMDHIIYYKDAGELFSGAQTSWAEATDVGRGDSRGIEFLYEYSGRDFYAKAAATLSKSTRKEFPTVNEGKPFHAPFDRRWVASATVEWRRISLTFTYQDGNWVNGRGERYEVKLPDEEPVTLEYYSSVNNHQMPAVIRLDAGYRLRWKWGKVQNDLNLGVCNLLNHFNPYTVYYDTKEEAWKEMALLPILPNFSWRVEF